MKMYLIYSGDSLVGLRAADSEASAIGHYAEILGPSIHFRAVEAPEAEGPISTRISHYQTVAMNEIETIRCESEGLPFIPKHEQFQYLLDLGIQAFLSKAAMHTVECVRNEAPEDQVNITINAKGWTTDVQHNGKLYQETHKRLPSGSFETTGDLENELEIPDELVMAIPSALDLNCVMKALKTSKS